MNGPLLVAGPPGLNAYQLYAVDYLASHGGDPTGMLSRADWVASAGGDLSAQLAEAQGYRDAAQGYAQQALGYANQANASGIDANAGAALIALLSYAFPAGMAWSPGVQTYVFKGVDGKWRLYNDVAIARALCPVDMTDPTITFHVDAVAGVDTRTGIAAVIDDFSNAVRTTTKAVALGNASGKGFQIRFRNGQVITRFFGPKQSVAGNQPQYPCAMTVEGGGRATLGTWDPLAWAADTSNAGLYKAAQVSSRARAVDPTTLDAKGVPMEYAYYATPALLLAAGAVNGWSEDSASAYARRQDGAPVTDANIRVLLKDQVFESEQAVPLYIEGLDVWGGQNGSVFINSTGTLNFASVRCNYYFPGYAGAQFPAWRMNGFTGIGMSVDDKVYGALNDAWNLHGPTDPTKKMWGIIVRLEAKGSVGSAPITSNNTLTAHNYVRFAAIEPICLPSINGSPFRNVDSAMGIIFGGTIPANDALEAGAAAVRMGGVDARAYLLDTVITGTAPAAALRADGGGSLYTSVAHPPTITGAQVTNGGTIATF